MKQLKLNFEAPADPKAARREAYAQKQEAKKERLKGRAEKAKQKAAAARANAKHITDAIPFGQPILVGHHSEGRHRRDQKRLHQYTRTEFAEQDKANRLLARANFENTDISSDDPDAIEKLQARVAELEKKRAEIKAFNKKARSEKREAHPSWVLSNLGANIRRLKGRITELEEKEAQPERAPQLFEGLRIEEDKDDNRIRLIFKTKPDKATRQKLRGLGFVWAPSQGAWQRRLDALSRYRAETFARAFAGPSDST